MLKNPTCQVWYGLITQTAKILWSKTILVSLKVVDYILNHVLIPYKDMFYAPIWWVTGFKSILNIDSTLMLLIIIIQIIIIK